jgi:hypothetical protein
MQCLQSWKYKQMISQGREEGGAQAELRSEMHVLQGLAARLGRG